MILKHHFDTDVDECIEGIHQCHQVCQNIIGSYTCGCNDGFMLDTDGRSCNGKSFFSTLSSLTNIVPGPLPIGTTEKVEFLASGNVH